MLNAELIAQIVVSGLLMGLIYALIAAGLSLIFGLMDVVPIVIAEIGLILFLNWGWAGAALGIQIPVVRDNWINFQFQRSKLPYYYFALGLAAVTWWATFIIEDSKWGYYWRAVKEKSGGCRESRRARVPLEDGGCGSLGILHRDRRQLLCVVRLLYRSR